MRHKIQHYISKFSVVNCLSDHVLYQPIREAFLDYDWHTSHVFGSCYAVRVSDIASLDSVVPVFLLRFTFNGDFDDLEDCCDWTVCFRADPAGEYDFDFDRFI